ncbi:hypothetical protein CDL12_11807 [Handroanthus impetiginosus]|uniref:Transmembrane protein n=1 Tax=Handroanthus impetiginosus TaxID=429701 RepID=A0A2G9HDH8_9LAMI|nr:hypothetical protein CDL12_11807 [Handroanthus impetiginosus]
MEYSNSKGVEAIKDIESGDASHDAHSKRDTNLVNKWEKVKKFVGGILGFNGLSKSEPFSGGSVECPNETMELLIDKNPGGRKNHGLLPVDKDHDKEIKKVGKVKKAPKPPRPPRGPSLDAADMRLVKEISKISMKKRERIERIKALKKTKAAKLSYSSSGSTISAMIVTILFFLVLILQGLGSSTSSNLTISEAPQPAPETTGLTPIQFYKTVLSDDGAAPSFVPPKSKE